MTDYLPDNPDAYDLTGKTMDALLKALRRFRSAEYCDQYDSEFNVYDRAEEDAYRQAVMDELAKRRDAGDRF